MPEPHYCTDISGDDETGGGFFNAACRCGWSGGLYPTPEDAADALMDHAYQQGWADAMQQENPPEARDA